MKIAIVGCLHGDEKIGQRTIELMQDQQFYYFYGNPRAMQQDVRYIDADMNRVFPGKRDGNHEEQRAAELLQKLQDFDYVIDLHSTRADTENFLIYTKKDEKTRKLLGAVPMKKAVFMEPVFAQGKSLIDHVCGVSLEFNLNAKPEEVRQIIIKTAENLSKEKCVEHDNYSVYGVLEKSRGELNNFELVEVGGEKFYPILAGVRSYKDIACLKARSTK